MKLSERLRRIWRARAVREWVFAGVCGLLVAGIVGTGLTLAALETVW